MVRNVIWRKSKGLDAKLDADYEFKLNSKTRFKILKNTRG
jgi:hypothetical protein